MVHPPYVPTGATHLIVHWHRRRRGVGRVARCNAGIRLYVDRGRRHAHRHRNRWPAGRSGEMQVKDQDNGRRNTIFLIGPKLTGPSDGRTSPSASSRRTADAAASTSAGGADGALLQGDGRLSMVASTRARPRAAAVPACRPSRWPTCPHAGVSPGAGHLDGRSAEAGLDRGART